MVKQQHHTKMIRVQASKLRVHPTAQRAIVPVKLRQLKADFDLDAIGVLHAVRYPIGGVDCVWVIDGQHRLVTLIDQGLGDWEVDVNLYDKVSDDAEASKLFLKLNKVASVGPFDKFMNEIRSNNPMALGVQDVLSEAKIELSRYAGSGRACCVGSLCFAWRRDSGKSLRLALQTIVGAWGRSSSALEGKIIEGLVMLYRIYGEAVEVPVLTQKLAKYPGGAAAILGDAKGLRGRRQVTVPRCVAAVMVEVYNSSRRSGKLDPI